MGKLLDLQPRLKSNRRRAETARLVVKIGRDGPSLYELCLSLIFTENRKPQTENRVLHG